MTNVCTIVEPKPVDLNDRGFSTHIKVHSESTVTDLLAYGFTNKMQGCLYFCKMLNRDISFNLTINADDLTIRYLDVLHEDSLQPYDYQRIILANPKELPVLATEIFDKVDELMLQLQQDNVITGYSRGMYL